LKTLDFEFRAAYIETMSWTLFILILLAAVAVIGGLNTVCEFGERM
jgi:hypothetical protein